MKRIYFYLLTLLFFPSHLGAKEKEASLQTPFERSGGLETATYREVIDYYYTLMDQFATVHIEKIGMADGDLPLYVVYYSTDKDFKVGNWHEDNKIIVLINNGIHPGEPDGIDASMMLLRDVASGKAKCPENVVLAVIPVFNVGGAINRSSTSRANQNGPLSYGFRGNAQNLDLNRDFIKCDASETRALEKLFTQLDPDLFIDNHVSDGADYQHVMTLLATQHDKAGGKTGAYMYNTFTPKLYKAMKTKGYDMVPYVNNFDNTPEKGWREFYESPKFSSGYAALFQTMAYVPETHMLKPFKDRVNATYALMDCMIREAGKNSAAIKWVRNDDKAALLNQKEFVLDWQVDTTQYDWVDFKGYQSAYKTSEVSGLPRLYYDHNQPFSRQVRLYDHYKPVSKVSAPAMYVVPATWKAVISRLKRNGVQIEWLRKDSMIQVTAYRIENYENGTKPYEKHYLHHNVKVSKSTENILCRKGDCVINVQQKAKRFLIETLEPTSPDGFFAWNFFDGILQQKEYFGDYAFEDLAVEILNKDPELRKMLKEKQQADTAFAKNAGAQLDFVYRHSAYMEQTYMRYPVFRIE